MKPQERPCREEGPIYIVGSNVILPLDFLDFDKPWGSIVVLYCWYCLQGGFVRDSWIEIWQESFRTWTMRRRKLTQLLLTSEGLCQQEFWMLISYSAQEKVTGTSPGFYWPMKPCWTRTAPRLREGPFTPVTKRNSSRIEMAIRLLNSGPVWIGLEFNVPSIPFHDWTWMLEVPAPPGAQTPGFAPNIFD